MVKEEGLILSLMLTRRSALVALLSGGALCILGYLLAPQSLVPMVALSFGLAWASVVDSERMILPDLITLGLMVLGLVVSFQPGGVSPIDALAGALAGYGMLVLVAHLFARVRGREGLGRGDAKLLAAAGAWLGWQLLPIVLLIASTSALAWIGILVAIKGQGISGQSIPFGPFISTAFWACWIYQVST